MPQAPQGALRAVFAGIGRILNVTDKVRNKPADAGKTANGAAPETAAPQNVAPETTAPVADPKTETPETAKPDTIAPETVAEPDTIAPETVAPQTIAPETIAPESATPKPVAPEGGTEAPLPNYDDLTIASVRARLRNLSREQLDQLVDYEKAHANRADFIAMFERRIAKVESGS